MAKSKKELDPKKVKELENLVIQENEWLSGNENRRIRWIPESNEELLVLLKNVEAKMSDDVKRRVEIY